jgi:hypothetical protein
MHDSKAALATGVDAPITLDMAGLTIDQRKTLTRISDAAGHYTDLTMTDPKKTLEALERENVSTAIVFARASRSGTLDTSIVCSPRNLVGEALKLMTNEAMELAETHLPWLKVNFRFDVQVIDIDLKIPQTPILTILHQKDG